MRKTKKYYRDLINASFNNACSVLPEVIVKYGEKIDKNRYCISARSEYTWNYRVEGFTISNGSIYVNIYWQGDSTDGYDDILLTDVRRGRTIPADTFFDGERTRETHGDIHVTPQSVYNAILKIAENQLVIARKNV